MLRKIPLFKDAYYLFKRAQYAALRSRTPEEIFTQHYEGNFWKDAQSVSGSGSNRENTATLVESLRAALDRLGVKSLLDLPCGDFGWMSRVPLTGIAYMGGDIVKRLVDQHQREHAGPGREFRHLDLLKDELPPADCILCRDCLVHLSFADIRKALGQMLASSARYLATTTYPGTDKNYDIVTGDWRRLNLMLPPFSFPAPLLIIRENSTEAHGDYSDKELAFWDLAQLREQLGG